MTKPSTSDNFWKRERKSFWAAIQGIGAFFGKERHAKIHLLAAMGAVFLGWHCAIDSTDWLFLVSAIASVFISEMLNSAIEVLADKVEPQRDPFIKKCKDIAAGAVLIAAIYALVVASTILLPKLITLWF